MVVIGVVVLFGILILLFILALVFSLIGGDSFATVVRVIRDLVIIFLALEGALIVLALAILILQIARLVNLLQSEVKPILDNTQSTLTTLRGTVEFMSENLTQPIVKASGFFASITTLTSSAFGLRRALKRAEQDRRAIEKANDGAQ